MNMTQEMLEILIGKYFDGEITPSEQQILDAALEEDSQARELLEQWQNLHKSSREAVVSVICERGKAAEEVFERAWQRQPGSSIRRTARTGGYLHFAAGLAAGLVMGLALHFVLPAVSTPRSDRVPPTAIATTDAPGPTLQRVPSDETRDVTRNVDWYNFTDETGDQWLVEGLRESIVRPAVYDGSL